MTDRPNSEPTAENTLIGCHSVTQDDIHQEERTTVNGMEAWADRGVAGRGVLVDYHSWAQRNDVQFDRLSEHAIKLNTIKDIIRESQVKIRRGDILLLRTGEREPHCLQALERRLPIDIG